MVRYHGRAVWMYSSVRPSGRLQNGDTGVQILLHPLRMLEVLGSAGERRLGFEPRKRGSIPRRTIAVGVAVGKRSMQALMAELERHLPSEQTYRGSTPREGTARVTASGDGRVWPNAPACRAGHHIVGSNPTHHFSAVQSAVAWYRNHRVPCLGIGSPTCLLRRTL